MTRGEPPEPCPCGKRSGPELRDYAACCGRFIENPASCPAPDAEALMRSRYSAFVKCRASYLLATWHGSRRPASIEFEPDARWLGLEVRAHILLDQTHAEVEFIARQKSPGRAAVRLHERSRFLLEARCWYYVDGDQL